MINPEQRVWTETKLLELVDQEILELRNPNHCILKKASQVIEARHPVVPLRALEAFYVASCDLAQRIFRFAPPTERMRAAPRDAPAAFSGTFAVETLETINHARRN